MQGSRSEAADGLRTSERPIEKGARETRAYWTESDRKRNGTKKYKIDANYVE